LGSLQGLGAEERRAVAEDELIQAWGEAQRQVVVPDALFMRVRGPPPSYKRHRRRSRVPHRRPSSGRAAQGLATAVGKGILVLHLQRSGAVQVHQHAPFEVPAGTVPPGGVVAVSLVQRGGERLHAVALAGLEAPWLPPRGSRLHACRRRAR
jgi:hypothetical protein